MRADIMFALITGLLAAGCVVAAIAAIRRGRADPSHRGPWIVALVLAGAPALLIVASAVPAVISGVWWPVFGAIGLAALVVLVIWQPRWAAWAAIGSGLAFPVMLLIGEALLAPGQVMDVDLPRAIGFYTVRMLILAGLLWWATLRRSADASVS